ncbi:MAG: magnesium/cobalt transporter CorA [Pirellula sp.]
MKPKKNPKQKRSQNPKHRSAPGSAVSMNVDPNASPTTIRVIAFNGAELLEKEIQDIDEIRAIRAAYRSVWIDVTGLGSEEKLSGIAQLLQLHPLAMEDVVNVHQRSKVDEFPDSTFVVARMIDGNDALQTEQLSFFLMHQVLISFQERPGDCWEPLRQRIRTHRGKICDSGVDYLLYALLDAVIDSYFPAMEKLAEQVDTVESEIIENLNPDQMQRIHHLRGQLLSLRRSIRPHREMINELVRDSLPHISSETRVHLRDCYDHVMQVVDAVDTYRELTSDMRDFYLSSVSNSMNEVMKVLTIISTIFIPLSFVAGVYGMNFSDQSPWNMPELRWYLGYPFALALMGVVAFGLLVFFRKKRWL